MANNKYNERLIFRYLSGEASSEECEELKALLNEDVSFRKHFIEIRDIWNVSNANQFDATGAFNRFQERIHNNKPKTNRFVWLKYASVAASILIVFFIGKMSLSPETEELMKYSCSTEMGQRKLVLLPDSTQVWLGGETVLTYTSDFNKKLRKVSLSGEAFFDVTHQPDIPFVVISEDHAVKVLGTRFKLIAAKQSPVVETVLEEGKVHVSVCGKDLSCILMPGQKSVFNKKEKNLHKIEEPNMAVYTAITQGQLIFRNEPLSVLSKRLEKWYGVDIELQDEVKGLRFTGVIENESLEDILNIMAMSNGIQFTKLNGTIHITIN